MTQFFALLLLGAALRLAAQVSPVPTTPQGTAIVAQQPAPAWLVNTAGTNKKPDPPAFLRVFIDFPLTAGATTTAWKLPSKDKAYLLDYCEIRPGNKEAYFMKPIPTRIAISANTVVVTHQTLPISNPMPIMRMGCSVQEK